MKGNVYKAEKNQFIERTQLAEDSLTTPLSKAAWAKSTTLAQSINQARRMLKCSQEQENLAIIRRILLKAELWSG